MTRLCCWCLVFSPASFPKPFSKAGTIPFPNQQRRGHTPGSTFTRGGHGTGPTLLWARQRSCCANACRIKAGVLGMFLQAASKSPKLPVMLMGIQWPFSGPENDIILISVDINRSKIRCVHCSRRTEWHYQDGNV